MYADKFAEMLADLNRDLARRGNPVAAWFEDFPFVDYWTSFMDIHFGGRWNRYYLYPAYQRHHLWLAVIRPRVLQRDQAKCWVCRGRATEVHHASYHPFVMLGLADEWLYSVCRRCHDFVHKDGPDGKVTSNHDLWRRLHDGKVHRPVGKTLPTREQVAAWHALGNAQAEYAQRVRRVDRTS